MARRLKKKLVTWLTVSTLLGSHLTRSEGADFLINTSADAGVGSFRQAILDAALNGDSASFDSSLAGVSLINGGPIVFNRNLTLNALNTDGLNITHDIDLQMNMIFNSGPSGDVALFSGDISGTGHLTKTGDGTLILSGSGSYSGGTLLENGGLRITNSSGLGTGLLTVNNLGSTFISLDDGVNVANDIHLATSTLVNIDGGAAASLSGNVSESGGSWRFTKWGTGTLILSGTNTYTGGVYAVDGTIRLESDSGAGTGTLTLPGAVTLDLADGVTAGNRILLQNNVFFNVDTGTALLGGSIEQGGGFEKTGNGRLILSGLNSWTGGTLISAGILQGSSDSLQGDIVNNATIVFDQEGMGEYAGVLSGTGDLIKTGANALVMTGNSTYTGTTAVNIGELQVRGSLVSDVTVNSDGILSGSGAVGSVTNHGLLQPGDFGIGELTVNGDFTQSAAGQFDFEFESGGNVPGVHSDLLTVTGTANLDGTFNVIAAPGTYTTGTRYSVLTAAGGIDGQFAAVNDNLSLFNILTIYEDNSFLIELQRVLELADAGETANQRAAGAALDAVALTATGDLATLINDLGAETPDVQRRTLSQISGATYGTLGTVGILSGMQFQTTVNDRMINNGQFLQSSGTQLITANNRSSSNWFVRNPSSDDVFTGWVQGFGNAGGISGDGNAPGADYRQGGIAVGLDLGRDDTGVVGISNGNSFLSFDSGPDSRGRMNSHQFGLYALRHNDVVYGLGSVNYGYSDLDVSRTVAGGVVTGDPVAHQLGTWLETGISLDQGLLRVQPMVALQYQMFAQQGFTEAGGPGALTVAAENTSSLRTHLGARFSLSEIEDAGGRFWTPYVHARWVAELLNETPLVNASLVGAPAGGSFVSAGGTVGRHSGVFGTGVNVGLADSWSLFLNYDIQAGSRLTAHTGSAGLTWSW